MKDWYYQKKYLHFDFALDKKSATSLASTPKKVIKHNFSPLIHYVKNGRLTKRDKLSGRLKFKLKPRNLFYVSHRDGYIYSYYCKLIAESYERFLIANKLSTNIIAYRPVAVGDRKASNINFAKEAVDFLKKSQQINVLCLDISKFFDNINTTILKENWAYIISDGLEDRLPLDHYKVFSSLANFSYVEERDIQIRFNQFPRKRYKSEKSKRNTLTDRICSYSELREANRSLTHTQKLIRPKERLEICGIPQGTPISGLLSNVFLKDFDILVSKYFEKIGGFYRRYCDDIFLAFPTNISFDEVEKFISDTMTKISKGSIKFNANKTERRLYSENINGQGSCTDEKGMAAKIQYLGFVFDGEKVHIRSSSLSRSRSKIHRSVLKQRKQFNKSSKSYRINTRKVFKTHSTRGITPHDSNKPKVKGFVNYANRSGEIMGTSSIGSQLRRNDSIIREVIRKFRK